MTIRGVVEKVKAYNERAGIILEGAITDRMSYHKEEYDGAYDEGYLDGMADCLANVGIITPHEASAIKFLFFEDFEEEV